MKKSVRIELTGIRFGRLLVTGVSHVSKISNTGRKRHIVYWKCLCDCGKEAAVSGSSLRYGETVSCGCYGKEVRLKFADQRIDMVRKRFGRLLVVSFSHSIVGKKVIGKTTKYVTYWKCLCDCGKESLVAGGSLRQGRTHSCGCLRDEMAGERKRLDLTGRRFGKLVAVRYVETRRERRRWLCVCDCGKETVTSVGCLTSGKTRSCGCLQYLKGELSPLFTGFRGVTGNYVQIVRRSARDRGFEFSITAEDMYERFEKQEGKCVYTGLDLVLPSSNCKTATASLDRIDSSRGYTVDNIQWVHKDINLMKLDHSEHDFLALCRAVTDCSRDKIKNLWCDAKSTGFTSLDT